MQDQGQSESQTSHLRLPKRLFQCPGQECLHGLPGPPVNLGTGPLSDCEMEVFLVASVTNADSRRKRCKWELTLCSCL